VFTNGCFDILHAGHAELLEEAAREGDCLVVALNSDGSVRGLKGPARPVNPQEQRARVLAALAVVDFVVLFDESDPGRLIEALLPDVLVKGGDWASEAIIGADAVKNSGGRIITIPLKYGASTTDIIRKARESV
jgi:rfaE bifunctional protein nucleotidyltransferase chain/domain